MVKKIGGWWITLLLLLVLIGCSSENEAVGSSSGSPPSSAASVQAEVSTPGETIVEPTPEPSSIAPSPSHFSDSTEPAKETDPNGNGNGAPTPSPSPSSSPTPKPSKEPDTVEPAVDSITVSIEGNAEWGSIVAAESVVLGKGDTASGVLKRTAKKHKLSYEIRGSGALTYVEGIDGLYEFDDGPTSGWKFRVNGIIPDIGAGTYKLKPGDRLEWFYTSKDEAAEQGKESAS